MAAHVSSPIRRQSPPQKLNWGLREKIVLADRIANCRPKSSATDRTDVESLARRQCQKMTGASSAPPNKTATALGTVNALGTLP